MSRYIDHIPSPAHCRRVKLIVLSFSRSDTLGIYNAYNILGYRSYHILEAFKNGIHHMKILNEALESGLAREGKPFNREDFDKWFHGYDVITEIPCYMAPQFVAAYPEAKFLLVERNPGALVRSWKSTTFQFTDAMNSFQLSILKYFDPMLYQVSRFWGIILPVVTSGKGTTDEGEKALYQYYVDYLAKVKEIVPADKIYVVRLEDGLGWEQLCPILERNIPNDPWPMRHNADEFKQVMGRPLGPGATRAMSRLAAVLVPAMGVGAWYLVMEDCDVD
ncbi:uncharacterized protein BCR38DRAFT_347959 [Pseudomassariella vexata]|uniref:P-loop containing nucleoside triphosphate hydrolase protein n=1 Tax=Pseudomassariella vexata TaxID=1141098 RepID=A0A1Y2DQD0_9PEZI|nr:uncharacterized protein BCR38DRAFT_347959 [Pseudomassariella vexata]ORY61417.1 hypothetical protein BCR38DRAFT_347959 [Pseudomassariella vexata]